MKFIHACILLSALSFSNALSAFNVTFRVNMNTTSGFTTPEVNGTFNGWCGNCNPMTDANNDGIWESIIDLPAGNYEYKFSADLWTTQETLTPGSACTNTTGEFTNRTLTVSAAATLPIVCWGSCNNCASYAVTFQVNMADAPAYTTPYVSGSFNAWCGNCNPMTDANNDEIWETTIVIPAGVYEYKFSADNWVLEETLPVGSLCTITTGAFTNRTLQVFGDLVKPVVCWGQCEDCNAFDVTFIVNMNNEGGFTTPYVSGTFNGWCGNCNPMTDVNNDGIFSTTITLQAGYYEYKFSADNWAMAEDLPVGAICTVTSGGFTNRFITVTADATLNSVFWGTCTYDCENNTLPDPIITIDMVSGEMPVCAGNEVTFVATTQNVTAIPSYTWKVDGVVRGISSKVFSAPDLLDGQVVTCTLNGANGCEPLASVQSAGIVMDVRPVVAPSITITHNGGATPCLGQAVTFTAQAVNGGDAPIFQWSVDGNPVGGNSNSYTTTTLTSASDVQCVMTSNEQCLSDQWQMIWADEFNGTTIDDTKWSPDYWANGGEAQVYTNDENTLQVDNGQLHIIARDNGNGGPPFTSGRIYTKDKFSFKYGRVVGRIKVPSGLGTFPAFWMLGANQDEISWPFCGEIDIMEHINSESTIYGTVHWENNGLTSAGSSIPAIAPVFHEYSMEWDSTSIRIFIDGAQYHTHNITQANGSKDEFTKPFYLILNQALDGWAEYPNNTTGFPTYLDVDWVRVYQRNQQIGNANSAQAYSNVISVSFATPQIWFADSDGDGFGMAQILLSACEQPLGYVAISGDCNDNNAAVNPNAIEIPNGIDDNCNTFIDEGLGSIWYADADGDTYGNELVTTTGVAPPPGYVAQSGDCNDGNASIHPGATEICFNNIDENCNGTADENCPSVANDWKQFATPLAVGNYNSCNSISGNIALATTSAEAQSTALTGQDLWYVFTPISYGVQIKVSTTAFNALVELQNNNGVMIDSENIQSINGNENLNIGNLIPGQQYYIAVRNYNSAQGTGTFNICISDLPSSGCLSPAGNYTMCSKFKAIPVNAATYTYNFTSTQTNITYSRTQGSATLNMYQVNAIPTGSNYVASVRANYTVMRGNGTSETITIDPPTTVTITFASDPLLVLATTQDCPSPRPLGVNIRSNTTVCFASSYQWEFQLADLSEAAFTIAGGSTQYLLITEAMGFVPGETYNVRIRVTYQNGYTNPWGPVRCLLIAGGSGMAELPERSLEDYSYDPYTGIPELVLYPNPTTGERINFYITNKDEGIADLYLIDGIGRVVETRRVSFIQNERYDWTFQSALAAGLYQVVMVSEGRVKGEVLVVE